MMRTAITTITAPTLSTGDNVSPRNNQPKIAVNTVMEVMSNEAFEQSTYINAKPLSTKPTHSNTLKVLVTRDR